jgi:tRNA modification GTPase
MLLGSFFESPWVETDYASVSPLDELLVAHYPGPHSYTGNDLVEIFCHGNPMVVSGIIDALGRLGARLARPGEFTLRAFLNGRLDLAQAEAVATLVSARTRQAGRMALTQLEGGLSREIGAIRERLIDLSAELEARIDFPEEDLAPADAARLRRLFDDGLAGIDRLLATARRGRILRDGVRVVVAGRPNAGKSSLFNRLVGMERAIVTPHPGTTRDTLEAVLDLGGAPVVLIDTAGLREISDAEASESAAIEKIGIARSRDEIRRAEIGMLVIDATAPAPSADELGAIGALGCERWILALNKSDLAPEGTASSGAFAACAAALPQVVGSAAVSALTGSGMDDLENLLLRAIAGAGEAADGALGGPEMKIKSFPVPESEGVLVANLRHEELLRAAREALERAAGCFQSGESDEFTMVDLHQALEALGEIIGLGIGEAVLDRVFARFCVGK